MLRWSTSFPTALAFVAAVTCAALVRAVPDNINGGFNGETVADESLWRWTTLSDGVSGSPMAARSGYGAIYVSTSTNDYLPNGFYVVGGEAVSPAGSSGSYHDGINNIAYSADGTHWAVVATLPRVAIYPAVFFSANQLVIVGGRSFSGGDDTRVYSWAGAYSAVQQQRTFMDGYTLFGAGYAQTPGGLSVLLGGYTIASGASGAYDLFGSAASNAGFVEYWSVPPPGSTALPTPVAFPSCAAHGDTVYCAGGLRRDAPRNYSYTALMQWTTDGQNWYTVTAGSPAASVPFEFGAIAGAGVASFGGRVWVMGGARGTTIDPSASGGYVMYGSVGPGVSDAQSLSSAVYDSPYPQSTRHWTFDEWASVLTGRAPGTGWLLSTGSSLVWLGGQTNSGPDALVSGARYDMSVLRNGEPCAHGVVAAVCPSSSAFAWGLSKAAFIGVVVAVGVVLIGAIVLLSVCCCRRRKLHGAAVRMSQANVNAVFAVSGAGAAAGTTGSSGADATSGGSDVPNAV